MSASLRIVLALGVIVYFLIVVSFVKKKTLQLKYALLWLFGGVIMGILIIWPQLLTMFSDLIGIQTPMYGLFLVVLFFLIVITIALTAIVSKQTDRIKKLAQEVAMMERRLRALEKEQSGNTMR